MRWARGDSDPDAMLLINPKLDLKPVFHEAFRKDLRKDDNKGPLMALPLLCLQRDATEQGNT